MNTIFTWNRRRILIPAILVGVILLTCVGCQTFNLSEGDFQKQQAGQMVDAETGDAVASVGFYGYWAAMIALFVDWAFRK